MQPPEGNLFHLQGEFLEIDVPRRLVYSFRYEEPDPDPANHTFTFAWTEARASAGPGAAQRVR